ncbi:hypothetical protein AJ87_27295 [Rhizobium yanglingense]|nr:hypothetical protein AJ87_27295 [Rhizobium yanglingense]
MWGIDEGVEVSALYHHLVGELDKLRLAYLHIMHSGTEELLADIRKLWRQTLIINRPGRPRYEVGADIATGLADLESYGQMVLANPDLINRLKFGAPMNEADRSTYFGGTEKGFTDYPTLADAAAEEGV